MIGARPDEPIRYPVSEVAARHDASVGEDRRGVLETRVLLRDDEEIRVARGDLRQAGPLRAVALAGTAEHGDEPALRQRPQE